MNLLLLLLKALENSSLEEAEAFHQRTNQRILPNLDENIKNGNSLVNMAYARFDRSVYQNVSLMNKLKMFDWNAEFGNRKFDAIIGNPPYIRVQNMVHYSREEYDFYKSNHSPYVTAQTDTLDKYYLFIEKGLTLLNDGANPLCIEVLKNINASGLYELTERTNDILDEN